FFNQGGSMSDFFDKIFGQTYSKQASPNSGRSKKSHYDQSTFGFEEKINGKDYQTEINISISDAFTGLKKRLKVNDESIEIAIKPGIKDNQTMKISGKGYKGKFGGKNGNLLLTIKVNESENEKRVNNDLYLVRDISIYEALLGSEKTFDTFAGKFNLKIAPGTQQGKQLKLKDQGMPLYTDKKIRGDLFIKLNITMPETFNEKQKELLQEIKKLTK
ncbi:J domain-containing protein, partial [Candidatus Kapabacteria bacterium]|nr:J domain-containing protein [Candidatus Kapabacteria bacterium]